MSQIFPTAIVVTASKNYTLYCYANMIFLHSDKEARVVLIAVRLTYNASFYFIECEINSTTMYDTLHSLSSIIP